MPRQVEQVPGSKPKKLIKSQRPNNPSLASYSMKALFGQQRLDVMDNKFYQFRNSPLPFLDRNNNPQLGRKTQLDQAKQFSTELTSDSQHRSINDPTRNNLSNIRSQSLPRAFPDNKHIKEFYPQAIDFAQMQFDSKRQKMGMPPRSSLNELLYKKGIQIDSTANQQRQENVIKGIQTTSRRSSGSEISKFNFLDHNSIKNKQSHGYNIINCYPGAYM